jgi:hypothetical protein
VAKGNQHRITNTGVNKAVLCHPKFVYSFSYFHLVFMYPRFLFVSAQKKISGFLAMMDAGL